MTACTLSLDLLGTELTESERAHVAACSDCSLLLGGDDPLRLSPPATPQAPLPPPPGGALEALRAQPRATSWKRQLWILVAVQLAVVVGAGVFFSLRAPQPANTAPVGTLIGLGAAILLFAAATSWVAFRPRWRLGTGGAIAGSAAVLSAALTWGGTGLEIRSTWGGILHCVGAMSALSALPLLGALLGLRELGIHTGRAFAAGLSAAGAGLLLLHGVCPEGTGLHLTFGHLAPWVIFAAGITWVRGRVQTRSHVP